MANIKKIDALQSASRAAGLAVACDYAEPDSFAAAANSTPNGKRSPKADLSWAEPKFQHGFAPLPSLASPKKVLTNSFANWLVARMQVSRGH